MSYDQGREPLEGQLVNYGHWNTPYNELMNLYSVDDAQSRFKSRQSLDVIFGNDPTRPAGCLEIPEGHPWFRVILLDAKSREIVSHLFARGEKYGHPHLLFLEQIGFLGYPDDPPTDFIVHGGELPDQGVTYHMRPDGSVYGFRSLSDGTKERTQNKMSQTDADATLWEPWPTFGEWDSIIRMDRGAPYPGR